MVQAVVCLEMELISALDIRVFLVLSADSICLFYTFTNYILADLSARSLQFL